MPDQTAADAVREEGQAHLNALTKDYGQYVATEVIFVDGSRAFNPGHQVPASHVEQGLVPLAQVAKVNTKAAAKAAPAPVVLPAEKG